MHISKEQKERKGNIMKAREDRRKENVMSTDKIRLCVSDIMP